MTRRRVFERVPLAPEVRDSTIDRVAAGVRHDPRIVRCHGRIGGLCVPPGASAWTLGATVLVRAGRDEPALIAHEVVHVAQWREQGRVGFLAAYLRAYLRERRRGYGHWEAYRRIPAEQEAFDVDAAFTRAMREAPGSHAADESVPEDC